MEEFKGWWTVEFSNHRTIDINIETVWNDPGGYPMYLVTHDKVWYPFHNVLSMRKKK